MAPSVYLANCFVYRNEAPYLAEWIEFHKLVGYERFFLYNHGSTDNHREVLAPYVEDGTVILEDWAGYGPESSDQAGCNFHCVEEHRHEIRWLSFADPDEFLFSPTGRSIPEVLEEFEYAAGVYFTRPMFGSSGHLTPPAGLTIENYTRRGDGEGLPFTMKRVVNPERFVERGTHPGSIDGKMVNTDHQELEKPVGPVLLDKLRLNHYFTRSEEEVRAKAQKPRADGKPQSPLQTRLDRVLELLDRVTDTTIHMYLPALREALAERERAAAEAKAAR